MFERSIQLIRAEKALRRGDYPEALELASQAGVKNHRRAEKVISTARAALLERARGRLGDGDFSGARRDLDRLGGDATLRRELESAEREGTAQREARALLLDRTAALVQVGYLDRARQQLTGITPLADNPQAVELAAAVDKAAGEADTLVKQMQAALAAGRLSEAMEIRRQLLLVCREKAAGEGPGEQVLQAWVLSMLAELGTTSSAWTELEKLVAAEPGLAELSVVKKHAERIGDSIFQEAESLFDRGDIPAAVNLLKPLREGVTFHLVPVCLRHLATLVDASLLALAGRSSTALVLARSVAGVYGKAKRWAERQEKELPARDEALLAALRLVCRDQPGAGLAQLAGTELAAGGVALRETLEELAGKGEEQLTLAEEAMGEGRPEQALTMLAEVRNAGLEKKVQALAVRALTRIRQAGEEAGKWRVEMMRVRDHAAVVEVGRVLEKAGQLDREEPGLAADFTVHEQGEKAAALYAEAVAAFAIGNWVQAADDLSPGDSQPPALLVGLRQAIVALTVRVQEAALAAGPFAREAGRVAAACKRHGIRIDPALVRHRTREQAEPGYGAPEEGFILRVATAGDLLVLPRQRLTVGSVSAHDADLRILTRIGRRHAELERLVSFHQGTCFSIHPLGDNQVKVGGKVVRKSRLEDGDVIQLGPVFQFRFRRPLVKSTTAILELGDQFPARGCRRVAWLKEPGWDGALTIGTTPDVHLRAREGRARIEFCLDRTGKILCRSTEEIRINGKGTGTRETVVKQGQEIESGNLTIYLDGIGAD